MIAIALSLMLNSPCLKSDPVTSLEHRIVVLNKHISHDRAHYLSKFILKEAKTFNIDPIIALMIVKQESNFQRNTIACTSRSCDYGLMQINEVTVQRLSLNIDRLVKDDAYNIHCAFRILNELSKQYGNEVNFWSRYHDSRPKQRAVYEAHVKNIVNKYAINEMLAYGL